MRSGEGGGDDDAAGVTVGATEAIVEGGVVIGAGDSETEAVAGEVVAMGNAPQPVTSRVPARPTSRRERIVTMIAERMIAIRRGFVGAVALSALCVIVMAWGLYLLAPGLDVPVFAEGDSLPSGNLRIVDARGWIPIATGPIIGAGVILRSLWICWLGVAALRPPELCPGRVA
jgi:hypothetical protein